MHDFFMETAERLSKKSKCVSYKVGAVLTRDNRIISMGYNGTPSGFHKECNECFNKKDFNRHEHHLWSNMHEIHAEMNCIIFAAKNGISIDGCTLYTTLYPCDNCLKNLSQSGIIAIIYKDEYDKSSENNLIHSFISEKIKIIKYAEIYKQNKL